MINAERLLEIVAEDTDGIRAIAHVRDMIQNPNFDYENRANHGEWTVNLPHKIANIWPQLSDESRILAYWIANRQGNI
jgi:hypothetical protein